MFVLSKYLYFGEKSSKTVNCETPLVLNIRKVLSSALVILCGLSLILASVGLFTYYLLFYYKTSFFVTVSLPLLALLQGIIFIWLFFSARRKNSYFRATSLNFLAVIEIIKAVSYFLGGLFVVFCLNKRYVLINYIKEKYLIPVLVVLGIIFLGLIVSSVSYFRMRSAVINNIPKKGCVLLTAVLKLIAGVLSIGIIAGCYLWGYAKFVLNRHIIFPYSNFVVLPVVFFMLFLYFIFTAVILLKYYNVIKKENK